MRGEGPGRDQSTSGHAGEEEYAMKEGTLQEGLHGKIAKAYDQGDREHAKKPIEIIRDQTILDKNQKF